MKAKEKMNMHRQSRVLQSTIYFPVILGFPLIIWTVDLLLYNGPLTLSIGEHPVQRVLGEVVASCILTLFSLNLLMSTRAHWVERIFGGLDNMYLIHRRSAVIALALLVLHVAISPRYPELNPGKPLGVLAMLLIFFGIALSAAPFFKRYVPYHKWLTVHRLMGPFFILGVFHAFLVRTLLGNLPLVRTYILAIALTGIASWLYRVLFRRWTRPYNSYEVTDVQRFGDTVLTLEMAPTGTPLQSLPGQFAFFSFPGIRSGEFHPFTIASVPGQGRLRIAIKNLGDFTRSLQKKIRVGNAVNIEGPYGVFTQNRGSTGHQLWIAGGIGITPFLAMAHDLEKSELHVSLYWSVRKKDEAYFDNELQELAERTPGLTYTLWLSDENGPLTAEAIPETKESWEVDVFICGPEALRKSLTAQLQATGIPRKSIHSEDFTFR